MLCKGEKLAIGTAQFGMSYGIAIIDGQVQEDEITAILDLAWGNGIDTLDTAKAYGNSEEVIGSYLKKRTRSTWKIITKITDIKKKIVDQVQDSTGKMTVHPTIILAHSAELFLNAGFQSELQEIREKQSINKTGVSLYCENEIDQVIDSGFKPDVIQLPLNILDTKLFRSGIITRLHKKGIEIHARSAFLQGLFYLSDCDLKNGFSSVLPYLEKLKSIALEAGLTLAELSLLWLIHLKEVSKVVIGVDNANQLETHLLTLEKDVNPAVLQEALSIKYENENILNPSLWPQVL